MFRNGRTLGGKGAFQMGKVILDLLIPLLLLGVCVYAVSGKRDAYALMVAGAEEGLATAKHILPALVVLLSCVQVLRASGAIELLTHALSPACRVLGIPPETVPLVIIRPSSGNAALAVGSELMAHYGADSLVGRTAAVMLGSTETTFYTISVYFGAAKIKKTRYTIIAALTADLIGFIVASISTKLLF